MKLEHNRNFIGIEYLRFLCAVSILVYHYIHFSYQLGFDPNFQLPFHGLLKAVYAKGAFAVTLFWAISGFIFFWKYSIPISERTISFRKFFVLRFSRLYPLHLATFLLVAILQYFYFREHGWYFVYQANTWGYAVQHLFFVSGWQGSAIQSFNGPVWSVSVEIFVYFIFFIAAFLMRLNWGGTLLVFIFIAIGNSFASPASGILGCATIFFWGGIIYHAYEAIRPWRRIYKWAIFLVPAVLLGARACFRNYTGSTSVLNGWAGMELIQIATILGLFLMLFESAPQDSFVGKFSFVGNLTYSSYLLHFPVQLATVLVLDHLGIARSIFSTTPVFLLYLGGVLALAFLAYVYFEHPAQNWLRGKLLTLRKELEVENATSQR